MRYSGTLEIPVWGWIGFCVLILLLLVIDLLSHRRKSRNPQRDAFIWTIIWIGAGLLFNGVIWVLFGTQAAEEYLAAYVVEKSLSLDNIFLFYVVFESLKIPREHQHRILFWGIFGAIVFRAVFILLGAAALRRWEFISYVFGAVLLYAGYHVFRSDPSKRRDNKLIKWLSRHLPVTPELRDAHFIIRENGKRLMTPAFIALVTIELSDIVFAVDSVPAAFSMSREPFIVYSSNVFAMLGLRALYTTVAHLVSELKYLHYGLAGVLGFAGVKLIIDEWFHVPPLISVGVIVLTIGVSVWLSVRQPEWKARAPARAD